MDKRIFIIGAGAAAVAAGIKLLENGFKNVTILEAQRRIGGRIHTIPFSENTVDLGAQCGKKEFVSSLMRKSDVGKSAEQNLTLIQANGKVLANETSLKLMELALDIIVNYADEKMIYKSSLGNFFMEKFYDSIQNQKDKFSEVDERLYRQFTDFIQKVQTIANPSDSWYETSCQKYAEQSNINRNIEWNWESNGCATIFDLLQKKTPGNEILVDIKQHVIFNKEVTKISYDLSKSSTSIQINCADDTVFEADHVISTLPLGVLKQCHLCLFEPILPHEKIDSINGLDFGTINSIFIEWDQRYWLNHEKGFAFLWDPEQLKTIRETEFGWLEDIFALFPVKNQPNVLCGWIVGEKSRQMEAVCDDCIKNGISLLIQLFLKDFSVPDPINIIRSCWFSNPYFRGSHTNHTLKNDGYRASTMNLSKPLKNSNEMPVIQFAGEATSEQSDSTVSGAIETGWREANRLINLYKSL